MSVSLEDMFTDPLLYAIGSDYTIAHLPLQFENSQFAPLAPFSVCSPDNNAIMVMMIIIILIMIMMVIIL